jgi:hypothetical protein
MKCELLVLLLGLGVASSAAAQLRPGLVTVAVDMTRLDAASFAHVDGLGLEKRILLRLVEDGFAVVRPEQGPNAVVSVRADGAELVLEARALQSVQVARVAIENLRHAELHLELTQRLVALLYAALAPPVQAAAPAHPPLAAEPRPPVATPAWELRTSAQVLVRSHAADPLLGLAASTAVVDAAWLDVDGAWSTSGGKDLSVNEWQLAAGASYRRTLGENLYGSVGLQAGALAHHYEFSAASATQPRGTRFDTLYLLPLRLTRTFGSRWQIGLQVTPGVANRGRGHETSAGFVWKRSAWRVQSGITVSLL